MRYPLLPIIFICFLAWSPPVFAQENIRYTAPETFREKEILKAFLESNGDESQNMVIAKADLNNDFINEYVLKPANCRPQVICRHTIMAYMNEKPIILGEIDAHKLLIGFKKDYGVRRLIVYNQSQNDFTSVQARWNPYIFLYEMPKN